MVEKISQKALNQMAVRGAKVTRQTSSVPSEAEVAVAEPPAPPPPAAPDPLPFASMQASMDRMGQQLTTTVENNTRAIERFGADMANQKPRAGVAYRATVARDRNKLIEYVDIIPMVQVK